jgi:hypothetical protein
MGKHSLSNISGHAWIIEHMKDSLSVIGNVVEDFGKWCSQGISLIDGICILTGLTNAVKRQTATCGVYKRCGARIVATTLANLVGAVFVK